MGHAVPTGEKSSCRYVLYRQGQSKSSGRHIAYVPCSVEHCKFNWVFLLLFFNNTEPVTMQGTLYMKNVRKRLR